MEANNEVENPNHAQEILDNWVVEKNGEEKTALSNHSWKIAKSLSKTLIPALTEYWFLLNHNHRRHWLLASNFF